MRKIFASLLAILIATQATASSLEEDFRSLFPNGKRPLGRLVTLSEARGMLGEIEQRVQEIHPEPFHAMEPQDWVRLLELKELALERLSVEGKISALDLTSLALLFVASFRDGHTTLTFGPNVVEGWFGLSGKEQAELSVPGFRLAYEAGRFRLRCAPKENAGALGLEVTRINGLTTEVYLKPLRARSSAENDVMGDLRAVGRHWKALPVLAIGEGSHQLQLQTPSPKLSTLNVPMVPFGAASEISCLPAPQNSGKVEWKKLDASTAWIGYPEFDRAHDAALESAFGHIKQEGVKNLILDLRGNGGGDSGASETILKHIYRGKWRNFSSVKLKISPAFLEKEGMPFEPRHVPFITGKVFSRSIPYELSAPKENVFSGKVWLLVDHATFSSATDFAAMFKAYGMGTIVGWETGGIPTSFGDSVSQPLSLSNQLILNVSTKHFQAPELFPGHDAHGLVPDVPLDSSQFNPSDEDGALAWLHRYIARKP